jgi:hypothetical protein
VAGAKLDGAGLAKMKTLDEAILLLQRVHGLVESYAISVKRKQPSSPFLVNIRRTLPSLAENLKAQFGLISDLITTVNLHASRGGSEAMRVRVLREGVARTSSNRLRSRSRRRGKSTPSRTQRKPTRNSSNRGSVVRSGRCRANLESTDRACNPVSGKRLLTRWPG